MSTVDIWKLSLTENNYINTECLSALEKNRAQNFFKEEDRKNYISSHVFLREVLTHYFPEIKPEEWCFDLNAYSKPSIAPNHGVKLHFNLSHTNSYAYVVCSKESECGIDIEEIKEMDFTAEGKTGITALDGAVKISTTKSGIGRLLAKKPSAADFVVEGHVKGTGLWRESPPSRIGITAAGGTIKLALGFPTNPADSTTPATLQYYIEGKGWTDTGIKDVKFFHAWHKLKIDKNGNTVRFYYDDRFVEEDVIYSSDGGKLGYFVENAEADLSWIGFSNY